jgi:hypothetical protein
MWAIPRIYRLRGDVLEQLTQDHRVWVSRVKATWAVPWASTAGLTLITGKFRSSQTTFFLLTTDGFDCLIFNAWSFLFHILLKDLNI